MFCVTVLGATQNHIPLKCRYPISISDEIRHVDHRNEKVTVEIEKQRQMCF